MCKLPKELQNGQIRLKDKLKATIEEEGIDLVEEDASDIEDLVSEITEEEKAKNHFRNINFSGSNMHTDGTP